MVTVFVTIKKICKIKSGWLLHQPLSLKKGINLNKNYFVNTGNLSSCVHIQYHNNTLPHKQMTLK